MEAKLKKIEQQNERLALREKQLMEEALFNEELILNSAENKMKQAQLDLLEKIPNPDALIAELTALRQKVKEAEASWNEADKKRQDLSDEVRDQFDQLKNNQKSDLVEPSDTSSQQVEPPQKRKPKPEEKVTHPSKLTSLFLTCVAVSIVYSNRADIADVLCSSLQSVSDTVLHYTGIDASEHGKTTIFAHM